MSKGRVIPIRLARKAAHAIVSAAIHQAIHSGATSRFNNESAWRVHDELVRMLDREDTLCATMDKEKPYLA